MLCRIGGCNDSLTFSLGSNDQVRWMLVTRHSEEPFVGLLYLRSLLQFVSHRCSTATTAVHCVFSLSLG